MPRARLISFEFWTLEAVIVCAPMTRLLLIGLSTFADDFGVLPLQPCTLRLRVFPGDAIDDDQVRAMLDELAARGLVRRYTVDDVEYLSIADWAVHQRVHKRARRRHPALPDETPAASTPAPNDCKPLQTPPAPASDPGDGAGWHSAIDAALRRACGGAPPADAARFAARWRAEGRDLERDVLPAIDWMARIAADCRSGWRPWPRPLP